MGVNSRDLEIQLGILGALCTSLLQAVLNHQDEAEVVKKFRALDDARSKAASLLPAVGRTSTDFAGFFGGIGDAVITAQKNLDEASREYLAAAKEGGQSHVLPTVFRIPRVTAEMKFSLEDVTAKEVNIVFYSSSEEAKTLHQQSVSFEIVAVPPPPEYRYEAPPAEKPSEDLDLDRRALRPQLESLGGLESLPVAPARRVGALEALEVLAPAPAAAPALAALPAPAPELWLGARVIDDDALRSQVIAEACALRPAPAAAAKALKLEALVAQPERVLVFADGDRRTFFLVLARIGKKGELFVWQLGRGPASLSLLYRLPATAAARRSIARLHAYLAELADQQESLLRARR